MNDKNDSDELWNDLLDDATSPAFRKSLLAETVRTAGRRQRRRKIGAVGLAVPLLLLLIQMRDPVTPENIPTVAALPKAPPQKVEPAKSAEAFFPLKPEIITDDELFAMFPDHALALVGPPGRQRLVVLGERIH